MDMVGTVFGIGCTCLHFLLELVMDVFQVSEQQLKEAVTQAVEGVKFGKERHQWSLEGKGSGEGLLEKLCLLRKLGIWPLTQSTSALCEQSW